MTKRGRPKMPEGEAREHSLVVRVTAEDSRAIAIAAKQSGKCVSEYAREKLLSQPAATPVMPQRVPNRLEWRTASGICVIVPDLTHEAWDLLSGFVAAMEPKQ